MKIAYIAKKIDYHKWLGIYYVDYVVKNTIGKLTVKSQGFYNLYEAQTYKKHLSKI